MIRLAKYLGWVVLAVAGACGGAARMPKGPPPEYVEHDAGTPVFEGDREMAVPTSPPPVDAGTD